MSAYKHAIKDFEKGRPFIEQIKADKLNAILRELESVRITQVIGGTFKKLPGGTQIVIQKTAARAASTTQPWDLIAATDSYNENQYKVTVRPGTLNGFLPSNWDEEFSCSSTGLYYAKAVITTDGTTVSSVSIEINTTPPTVQTPQAFALQTSIRYLFGLFSAGSSYRVISDGHISLNPTIWMTKQTATPAQPGELPWEQFYQLSS